MRAAKAARGSVASGARTLRPGPPGGQVTASRQTASHYDGCRCAFRACLLCAAGYGRVWKVVKRLGRRTDGGSIEKKIPSSREVAAA
ncbi:hypothetical protein MTO96_006905 [Rhipicephalus appendiculatus]